MTWVPKLSGADPSLPRVAAIQGSAINRLIKEELAPRFADTVHIHDSIGPNGKIIVMINSANADKGSALAAACDHLGIVPADVAAFGDAENDIPMFRLAGRSFAMGQADEVTRAHATDSTRANTEDGVASGIRRLISDGAI